jgi:hypothetical protein
MKDVPIREVRTRDFLNMKKPSTEIMFLIYETAVYFLKNIILVTKIVIICFIFFGKDGRDTHQQTGCINVKLSEGDHTKTLTTIIIKAVIIQ